MPSSMVQLIPFQDVLSGKSPPCRLPAFSPEGKTLTLNGDISPPAEALKNCSLMSSVSMTTSSFSSSTEKLTKSSTSSSINGKKTQLETQQSSKTVQENRNFTRSFSLTSTCSNSDNSTLKFFSTDRRFSLDDTLDEKEEDVKLERNFSLDKLLDIGKETQSGTIEGLRLEHQSRDFVARKEERSTAELKISSAYSQEKVTTEERGLFTQRRIHEDISSSSSSLSSSAKVTFSSKGISSAKTSHSAQNLQQVGVGEMFQQNYRKPFSRPPLPKSAAVALITDQMADDLDLISSRVQSSEAEAAMSRICNKITSLVEALKVASSKQEMLSLLNVMNDLIRKVWAVSTYGYDLGSSFCNILRNKGGLDILIQSCSSDDNTVQFEGAKLLEQCLSTENRAYVIRNGLEQVVHVACSCSTSSSVEHSRIGTGILEHLFKHSEVACHKVIRLGGLEAILYDCRNCDVETLRHCAAALANLSLYGGPDNQESMIQHKVPVWLFPLAFHNDDNIKYYACLAIASLVANKEIEAAVLRSGTLDLVEPFVTSHSPEEFANSTVAHVHGQSKSWLLRLVPVLNSKREEARNLAAFHFAMEAGIKKKQGNTTIFKDIGAIEVLKKVASCPNAIASKFAAQALQLIGEEIPHKLSQQVPLWTVEDVMEWVRQIGFSQYDEQFLNSRVDGDLLLQMNDDTLKQDIGVENGILRKRFLRELNQLKCLADYSSCDATSIGSLLQSLGPEFCQYTYQMLQSGVSRDNLRFLTEEQLIQECGFKNSIHRFKVLQTIRGLTQQNETGSEEELNPKCLDVFISYRRSNGSQLASLLKVHLQLRGFTVFIDVERLEAGKFDNNLVNSVRQARHFLLVLTANALDRCIDDTDCKDWVHKVRIISECLT